MTTTTEPETYFLTPTAKHTRRFYFDLPQIVIACVDKPTMDTSTTRNHQKMLLLLHMPKQENAPSSQTAKKDQANGTHNYNSHTTV